MAHIHPDTTASRRQAPARSRVATEREVSRTPLAPFPVGLPGPDAVYAPVTPAGKALKEIITSASYDGNFDAAITRVAGQGIPELSRIQTLDQFYFYVDALVNWRPEIRHWEVRGHAVHERTVYLRIVQFYYYFNQPELEILQSPVCPESGQDLTPLSAWLRRFAVDWGEFLDTGASADHLESFRFAPEYSLQDFAEPTGGYPTFNAFFARTFKDIDRQRPVARKDDDTCIVFPAESTFVGQWTISTAVTDGPLTAPPSIVVKHIEWPIAELLATSNHADAFAGGRLCHSFLNTYDYHRLHTPVAGTIVEARFIPGQVYLDVLLKSVEGHVLPNGDLANAVIPQRYLDAEDPTGYQFVQCRGLLVIENPVLGKVAVLPMGMAQVSSVIFTDPGGEDAPIRLTRAERETLSYENQVAEINRRLEKLVGQHVEKGQMFSFFQFGGSDCVTVFERKANVNVTAQVGVHYPIRSQYAQANFNPA